MTTSSVPPYMDRLFTPATPVQQSNSGSVRKRLFISPEEALQEGMWDLPLWDTTGIFKCIFIFVCLSCSFLRMVIQMDRSLETKSSSSPAFSLPGSQMREKKKTNYKAKSDRPRKQLERISYSQAMILMWLFRLTATYSCRSLYFLSFSQHFTLTPASHKPVQLHPWWFSWLNYLLYTLTTLHP